MSAVAKLLQDSGWLVTGSDAQIYAPISTFLADLGIKCLTPHAPENIPPGVDLVVIGKHAKLRPELNPEVRAAKALPVAIKSFPEVLRELTAGRENIVIAGSYGKSTTTALIASLLEEGCKAPGYFIGAVPLNHMPTARIGTGKYFVLEGDEYPASNWDDRSKFLFYNPKYVLLTSCVHDHMNFFRTHTAYLAPFVEIARILPDNGTLVACIDEQSTRSVMEACHAKVVTYSIQSGADWVANDIHCGNSISFSLVNRGRTVAQVTSPLFGQHNVQNLLGACALLLEDGLLSVEALTAAIPRFLGLRRRLELRHRSRNLLLYEDMASSGPKARATFSAIRQRHDPCRLFALFEPYSLSFRHRSALDWYRESFTDVTRLFLVYPRPLGSYQSLDALEPEEISSALLSSGVPTTAFASFGQATQQLAREVAPGDIIVVVSSGGVELVIKELKQVINRAGLDPR